MENGVCIVHAQSVTVKTVPEKQANSVFKKVMFMSKRKVNDNIHSKYKKYQQYTVY